MRSSFDGDVDEYTESIRRLEKHVEKEPSTIVKRYTFFTRRQFELEIIDDFIAELRILASSCEFVGPIEQYLRDQLVVNSFNPKVQERLLCSRNPTLSETLQIARGTERSQMASKVLNKSKNSGESVNAVACKMKSTLSCKGEEKKEVKSGVCFRCGSKNHLANDCCCSAIGERCGISYAESCEAVRTAVARDSERNVWCVCPVAFNGSWSRSRYLLVAGGHAT
ncbi:hypothetical protein NDU88_012128 [Pleurodeles waltl]|uniref:CCHC-type domain-containing protein n=1 Tax=Pleurodeles waltl TaxID=8319 RepID=A0AAV7R0S5_PLEWA|nr:hypothetical protein NDU88_012128 [Pleurodeles waltl]